MKPSTKNGKDDAMPNLPKESSTLDGSYLTDGDDLYYVVAHTERGIRLENCHTNMQTYFTHGEFIDLKLRKVVQ